MQDTTQCSSLLLIISLSFCQAKGIWTPYTDLVPHFTFSTQWFLSEPLICCWILCSCLFVPCRLFSQLCFFFSLFSIYKWLPMSFLPTHLCLPSYFPLPFCLTLFAPYSEFPHFFAYYRSEQEEQAQFPGWAQIIYKQSHGTYFEK